MSDERLLIVNADDFGLSDGINEGIIQAHEFGIVTSTSMMVRGPAVRSAAEYSRHHPAFSVGLHLDFGEMVYSDGEWISLYDVLPPNYGPAEVREEVARQLSAFQELTGRKPTHMDSHQHRHRQEPVRGVCLEIAQELRIPLRELTGDAHYCGGFYGQGARGGSWPEAISVERLKALLEGIPAGVTELGCHPGLGDDFSSTYKVERAVEVATLCDPRIRQALEGCGIRLISYRELTKEPQGDS